MFKAKEKLTKIMAAKEQDCILLVPGPNQFYFTGARFHTGERPTLIGLTSKGDTFAIIPALEKNDFENLNLDAEVYYWKDEEGYATAFSDAFTGKNLLRIGVEGKTMRFFEFCALRQAVPEARFSDLHSDISRLRICKTKQETEKLRKAIQISERALQNILPEIRAGKTEKEIESLLISGLFLEGAEGLSFPPIVASGANTANPHAHARHESVLQTGDALLFDFGAIYQGYHADITRTFFVGKVDSENAAFYETVLQANQVGIEATQPGISCHRIDDAVQTCLEDSAFSDFILHKTGHGLGLEVHEDPYIMRGNEMLIAEGMIFTVEPGLYKSGKIGVRIEDDVLVTETGCEVLTSLEKHLQILDC